MESVDILEEGSFVYIKFSLTDTWIHIYIIQMFVGVKMNLEAVECKAQCSIQSTECQPVEIALDQGRNKFVKYKVE